MSEKDKKNLIAQNGAPKKGEEKGFRAYFVRLFGKYDIRNEAQFLFFGKWIIFATLLFVEALIVLQQLDLAMHEEKWWKLMLFSSLGVVLSISFALKLFAIRGRGKRTVFYVLDALLACGFVFFERGNYSLIIYLLVLTGFYLASDKAKFSIWLFCIAMPLYGHLRRENGGAAWQEHGVHARFGRIAWRDRGTHRAFLAHANRACVLSTIFEA